MWPCVPANNRRACVVALNIARGLATSHWRSSTQDTAMENTAPTKEAPECRDSSSDRIKSLEDELKRRAEEARELRSRAECAERELATVLGTNCKKSGRQQAAHLRKLEAENAGLRDALRKSGDALKDKTAACARQGKQVEALTSQVSSLREVVAITKDLLTIRNLEVQQLQKDVDGVQEKIALEREKHDKMALAARLSADLRREYMNQVQLFQDLRGKYEQKVAALTAENQRLAELAQLARADAPQ